MIEMIDMTLMIDMMTVVSIITQVNTLILGIGIGMIALTVIYRGLSQRAEITWRKSALLWVRMCDA